VRKQVEKIHGAYPYELAGSTPSILWWNGRRANRTLIFFVMRLRFGITANTKRSGFDCTPQQLALLAQRALRNGDTRVGPLVFELGYTSESAFSNAVKREVSMSPMRP